MAKIIILSVGAIRYKSEGHTSQTSFLDNVIFNLQELKQCFSNHDVTTIISTWAPKIENSICLESGRINSFDYDLVDFDNQIKDKIDKYFVFNQQDNTKYALAKNNALPFTHYNLLEAVKKIVNDGIEFDFIIKTRHDNLFILNNVDKYLDGGTYIPPLYWGDWNRFCLGKDFRTSLDIVHSLREENKWNLDFPLGVYEKHHDALNDHHFIMSKDTILKYLDISDNNYRLLINSSNSLEQYNKKFMELSGEFSYIDNSDIEEYVNRRGFILNHTSFHWHGNYYHRYFK
jgi:hypothetical protein